MIIYPSVEELSEELEPGSVVLIPSNLLPVLIKYLNPALLDNKKGDTRLYRAPFYVLEAPTLHRVVRMDKYGVRVESELSPEASISERFKAKLASIKSTVFWERRTVDTIHPSLEDEAYVNYVSELIAGYVERHRHAVPNSPMFLALRTPTVESVELLSRVGLVEGVPTYVLVPVRLSSPHSVDLKLIKALLERGHDVAFLLGIDPKNVVLMTSKKKLVDVPLSQHIISGFIKDTVPIDDEERRRIYANNFASAILDQILDVRFLGNLRKPLPVEPIKYYSISTILLDALSSLISRRLTQYVEEHHHATIEEAASFFVSKASLQVMRRARVLAWYAEKLGATREIVEAIMHSGNLIEPLEYLTERAGERQMREELLYTN